MSPREARAHVEQMSALCRQGKTPPAFADFLERTCPPSPQGWVATMLFGSSARTVDVYDIQPYQDDPFREHRLFWAWATGVQLEQTLLPGRARLGLFSYGPGGYRYLSRRRRAIEEMLDVEGRSFEDFDPVALAQLFLDALANQGPYTHALLRTPSQLTSSAPVPGFPSPGYTLHEGEWARLQPLLHGPLCVGDEQRGWQLEFFSLYGWMHEKNTLCRVRYRVRCSPGSYRGRPQGFAISEQLETLSEKIFHTTPALRYLPFFSPGVRHRGAPRPGTDAQSAEAAPQALALADPVRAAGLGFSGALAHREQAPEVFTTSRSELTVAPVGTTAPARGRGVLQARDGAISLLVSRSLRRGGCAEDCLRFKAGRVHRCGGDPGRCCKEPPPSRRCSPGTGRCGSPQVAHRGTGEPPGASALVTA
jgi:hypothetical protein